MEEKNGWGSRDPGFTVEDVLARGEGEEAGDCCEKCHVDNGELFRDWLRTPRCLNIAAGAFLIVFWTENRRP